MEFIQSTLFSNIIAVIALLVAIASFVYAYMSNRPSIKISEFYTDQLDNESEPIKFGFVLANVSPKTITVKEINLLDSSNKKLENIHVQAPEDDWKKYPNPSFSPYDTYVLERPEIFIPNAKIEFSYHLKEQPKVVEIVTDKHIYYFSKKRKFNF
ncbi:hypothetical protein AB6F05_12865 [Staphylococcus haemolyticus]|uniref:hypothetical protein n=1 Tax=Staphylococcus haemolyticus TaxID=1283 RepID=UPI0034DD4B03